jgi:hypothetical protein
MKNGANIRRGVRLSIAISIWLSSLSYAEIIPQDRRIDWSQAGIPGGIPNRTTICATINAATYGNGTTDATAAIQNAIANCPADQVVYLPAGTYLLTSPVDFGYKSRVTLRGAGMGQTILRPQSWAAITTGQSGMSSERRILSGSTKGSTTITVDDASGIQAGSVLDIYQGPDPDFYWSRGNDPDNTGQHVKVTAVNGTTIQFEDPLFWNLTLNPRVKYQMYAGMSWGGVEDLTITGDSSYAGSMIQFWNTYACWIKGVETAWGNGNEHIFLYGCLRNEIRDSYIHDTYSTTDGYGILTMKDYGGGARGGCTGLLVENNIFSGFFYSIILETEVGGVIAYNYSRNARLVVWPDYQVPDFSTNHSEHGMMDLWEGNIGAGFQNDGYHGSTSHITLFRNWFSGRHVDANRTGNIKTVDLTRFSYYHNVVGNVLGNPDWPRTTTGRYEMTGQPGYTEQSVIYRLGYPNMGNNGYSSTNPPSNADDGGLDPKVKSTLMRWGNFDYQNNLTKWDASEIPGGVPVPTTQTLPASLYYSSKPSWWPAGVAWPVIGPDVSGLTNKIPAQLCYETGQIAQIASCLKSSIPATPDTTPPSPPQTLRMR